MQTTVSETVELLSQLGKVVQSNAPVPLHGGLLESHRVRDATFAATTSPPDALQVSVILIGLKAKAGLLAAVKATKARLAIARGINRFLIRGSLLFAGAIDKLAAKIFAIGKKSALATILCDLNLEIYRDEYPDCRSHSELAESGLTFSFRIFNIK